MPTTEAAPRAVIYLRQSKDSENTGLAIERQEKDCRRLCNERGWTVVAVLPDNDTSASNGKVRPRYQQALAMLDRGQVDVLVAWHVDRLTRRLTELEDLIVRCERTGAKVATVSGDLDLGSDAGRLVGRILASVARGEIERKSARQKRAGRQAAEDGLPPKRRAFGFTNGAHDPTEAPALVELYNKVISGTSLVAATKWLNGEGHRTTTGKPWDRSSVRKMLLNPRNAGLRQYGGEVLGKGKWKPIIKEEVWRATVEELTKPERRPRQGTGRRWLGANLYICGACGSRVRVNYSHAGTRIYQCKAASHLSRSAEPVDALVVATMVELLGNRRYVEALAPAAPDTSDLRDRARLLRLRLKQVEDDYADAAGRMSFAMFERVTAKLSDELAQVNARLAEAGSVSALDTLLADTDPVAAWRAADVSTQQAVLDAVATVTIMPVTRSQGSRAFDDTAIRIEPRVPSTNVTP